MQTKGKQTPSAAMTAGGTSSTYGGVSGSSSATSVGIGGGRDFKVTPALPVSSDNVNDTPVTFGHIKTGWMVLAGFVSIAIFVGAIVWSLSAMSSKVEQNVEAIKDGKGKTEKLMSDSAVMSEKLQKLDSEVGKLQDKVFDTSRPKK